MIPVRECGRGFAHIFGPPLHRNGNINVRFRPWTFWITGTLTVQKVRTAVGLVRQRLAGRWRFTQ